MFFAIPNLSASTAFEVPAPWELPANTNAPYSQGKIAMTAWAQNAALEHHFISAYEGMSAGVRVLKENPVFRMHALIVDYDGLCPENPVEHLLRKPPVELLPQYVALTMSGHCRLVWLFEKPMLFTNATHFKAMLLQINRGLKLDKWMPALDTSALGNVNLYYELGTKWLPVRPGKCIPSSHLEMWNINAAMELPMDYSKNFEYNIPIDDLAREVSSRYPGRWTGPFQIGARGLRFWDSQADNPTAAVVHKDGMICFTGGQGFVPWKQIFGVTFVEQYESSRVKDLVQKAVYDERGYWLEDTEGNWKFYSETVFAREVKCRGFSSSIAKGKTASEVDLILRDIVNNRRVTRALPFLFFPKGVIWYEKKPYLNTAYTEPTSPGAPYKNCDQWSSGRTEFPFIYTLLSNMFTRPKDVHPHQIDPLLSLIAWLKYFYTGAYKKTPGPGQALVLAGHAGKGKTLFSKIVVGGLMGGAEDASGHLVEDDQWTERLVEVPVWCIDDDLVSSSGPNSVGRFTSKIKKYVATPEVVFNQKYKATGTIPWFGRIIITCNLDDESKQILPNMELSVRDKISLFRCSPAAMLFPKWGESAAIVQKELPAFARFLLEWQTPEQCLPDEYNQRFGVLPYHDTELLDDAGQHAYGPLIEMLYAFLGSYKLQYPAKPYWEGTSVQLYQELVAAESCVVRGYTIRSFSTQLGQLASKGMYNISKYKDVVTHLNMWRIGFDLTRRVTDDNFEGDRAFKTVLWK